MSLNTIALPINQIAPLLQKLYKIRTPVILHGHPGCGKSYTVRAVMKALGLPLIEMRAAQKDRTDIGGYPFLDLTEKSAINYLPDWVKVACERPTGLFLDEFLNAPKLVQDALYELILDRTVGHTARLHEGSWVVAATNLVDDGSLVRQMSSALADRMTHIQVLSDAKSWIEWALHAGIDSRIIAFIKLYPQHLNRIIEYVQEGKLIAPSERSWEVIDGFLKLDLTDQELQAVVAGRVGNGVALEFFSTLNSLKDMVPVETLMTLTRAELPRSIPDSMAGMWTIAFGVPQYVSDMATLDKAFEIALALADSAHIPGVDASLPRVEIARICRNNIYKRAVSDLNISPRKITVSKHYAEAIEKLGTTNV